MRSNTEAWLCVVVHTLLWVPYPDSICSQLERAFKGKECSEGRIHVVQGVLEYLTLFVKLDKTQKQSQVCINLIHKAVLWRLIGIQLREGENAKPHNRQHRINKLEKSQNKDIIYCSTNAVTNVSYICTIDKTISRLLVTRAGSCRYLQNKYTHL